LPKILEFAIVRAKTVKTPVFSGDVRELQTALP
jgi:hypothetical protein